MKLGIGIGVSASRRIVSAAPSPYPNTYSLDFDGVDEYVDCGNMTELDNVPAFTLSMWMKFDNLTGTQRFMGKTYNSVSHISLATVGDEVYPSINGAYGGTTDANLVASTWYHIAMVFDGTLTGNANRLKFYIDGTQKTMSFVGTIPATTYDFALNPETFYLATDGYATPNYYGGLYDEASVWNTALSAADVATLATAPSNLKTALGTTPVAWWRMGDSGTFFNSIWELPNQMKLDNYSKYSMEFDGVDDYVDIGLSKPAALNLTGDMSISAWINLDTVADHLGIVCDLNSGGSLTQFFFEVNRTAGKLSALANGSTIALTSTTSLVVDTWYHVVLTRSGSTGDWDYNIYLDGSNDGAANAATNPQAQQGCAIGRWGNYNGGYFDGMIDSVSIWDEALTAGNVTSLFNSGVPNDVSGLGISGLVAYYRMGESAVWDSGASEWTIPDDSANSNDGTSSGMSIASRATSAPDNINQANSISMEEADRVTDVPT